MMSADVPAGAGPGDDVLHDVAALRAVIEATSDIVMLLDGTLRIIYINRTQTGFVAEEVLGHSIEEYTPPETWPTQRAAILEAMQTGQRRRFSTTGPEERGRPTAYETTVVPVDCRGQRFIFLVTLDVTERVERERALQESEARLRLLVDATGIALWHWDAEREMVEWNERMHEVTGIDELPPLSDYLERIVHPEDRELAQSVMGALLEGKERFAPHRIVRPDGGVRWVIPAGRALYDEHGRLRSLVGGMLDITAQRQAEEHLRTAQRIDAAGTLTSGVAHNFNNMLAVILPVLELVGREAGDELKPLVGDALHAAHRASELVSQLMTFAGRHQGGERSPHDMRALVSRAVAMCRSSFEGKVGIDFEPPAGAPLAVRCDPSVIEQVVVNLLINARDATLAASGESRRVRVELSTESTTAEPNQPPRDFVRVAVIDAGTGMSPKVQEHLFEPFFTTKGPGRGTGLGLSTSYGIVRDHGGFMRFDSREGVGTTAGLYLPREVEMAQAEGDERKAPADGPRGRVLVVDDEPGVRTATAATLEQYGHRVWAAGDFDALRALLDEGVRPDVVLLDHSIELSPAEAVSLLRARVPGAAIIFFSGQRIEEGERRLVDAVIAKPVRATALLELVAAHLRGRGGK